MHGDIGTILLSLIGIAAGIPIFCKALAGLMDEVFF